MNEEKVINEQKFYPNLQYNRAQRKRFFTLITLLIVCMGILIGTMVAINQIVFAIFFGIIVIFVLFLTPSALKSHPVKPDIPAITIANKEVTAGGKTYRVQDIEKVVATVLLSPVSKIDSENKEYCAKLAEKLPEEIMLGSVDIVLKKGLAKRGEEIIYSTVEDCLGATIALVSAGVKHYSITFNLKKINEPAKFSITKTETKKQSLTDISAKERKKQLI